MSDGVAQEVWNLTAYDLTQQTCLNKYFLKLWPGMSFVAWKYIFTYAVEGEFPQIKFGELFSLFDRMCCWGGGGGA